MFTDIITLMFKIMHEKYADHEVLTIGVLKQIVIEAQQLHNEEIDRHDRIMGEFLAPDMFDNG